MLGKIGAALAIALTAQVAAARTVTDLAGRTVEVPEKVERVILGEGRFLPTFAILDRDPTQRLVGIMADYERLDPSGYKQYADRFPALAKVERFGLTSEASFSSEKAIALAPQLAILGADGGHGPSARSLETVKQLEAAGAVVIFIDLRVDPLVNTPRSIELLGQVLGREQEAAEFLTFYKDALKRVTEPLAAATPARPKVFLESRVGLGDQCCESMSKGMLALLVAAAGGQNMADGLLPGVAGTINAEFLIANQPDLYVGTAIGSAGEAADSKRLALGAGVDRATALASLARNGKRPILSDLQAIRDGRSHSIWHHFYNSPFNVVAVQAMAKWFQPSLFADLDPQVTLADAYRRFQPVPLDGTYWAGPLSQ
ncbi:iron ABC transporter substrate-binding protein [Lacibacterium aquatile]|uniref:Iron ABC transporter substrate-binding protein n=1 Tax=Lacibacterium aquatile TaxID=1168082 RepID=A0ABW5DW68_9PROT